MRRFLSTLLLSTTLAFISPSTWAVNVNKADAKTLAAELNGVGKAKAEAIVQEREKGGPFKDGADLAKRVRGIGPAIIAKNRDKLQF